MTVTIPQGSLMAASLAGQQVAASLADPRVLSEAVMALIDAVGEMGNVPVIPVGKNAAMVVGAALMVSKGGVRQAVLPASGGPDRKALVVEAVAVGQANVERAIVKARGDGADWVGAWVWHASSRLSEDRIDADVVRFAQRGSE